MLPRSGRALQGYPVSRVEHRSVLGCNDRHDNAPRASDSRWARGWWFILLKEPDPGVSVVRLRVSAGGVEHTFDRVRGAGHVGPAFDRGERWGHQHQQQADDADDDKQFQKRKAGRPAATLSSGRNPDSRSRRGETMASKPSRQYR